MLHIRIVSVGKKHDAIFANAISRYEQKLHLDCKLSWLLIPTSDKESEGELILSKTQGSFLVLLDEAGKTFSSEELADFLQQRQLQAHTHLTFVIGGAYGASEKLKQQAHEAISLGKLTFPHQLVRLILLEQLYRGFSILRGSKYHHGSQ